MSQNIKIEKLNSLILRELNLILNREYKNYPIISNVSIHEVKTSNDLSITKIYYSNIIKDKDNTIEKINKELQKKAKKIRYKLAKKLEVYKIPKLIFVYDEFLDKANKIENILNEIHSKKETQLKDKKK